MDRDLLLRGGLLIDGAGTVACHWRAVRAAGHAEKVREKLRALRAGGPARGGGGPDGR